MSRTFTNLLTHVIFSTKDREPTITNELRPELFACLGGLTRELKGKARSGYCPVATSLTHSTSGS